MTGLHAARTEPLVHHEEASRGQITFDELFDEALKRIQDGAGRLWTDHNIHDPGITFLDAGLWSLSDLLFRADSAWEFPPVDLECPDARSPWLGEGPRALLDQGLIERIGDVVDAVRGGSVAEEHHREGAASFRWKLSQMAMRGQEGVEAAVDGHRKRSTRRQLLKLAGSIASEKRLRLGASELAAVVRSLENHGRRYLLHSSREVLDGGPGGAGDESSRGLHLESVAGLDRGAREIWDATERRWKLTGKNLLTSGIQPRSNERVTLAARQLSAGDPAAFEDESGRSRVWPPHPSQLERGDPVTQDDLAEAIHRHIAARRIGEDFGYRRAEQPRVWVVSGMIAGLRCDGREALNDDPERPGAWSVLVEGAEAGPPEQHAALLECCRAALEPDVPRRYWSARDLVPRGRSRRPLGLELYFGFVRPVEVRISGTLFARDGALRADVFSSAERRLRQFLRLGKQPPGRSYPTGWAPGAAIKMADVAALLRATPGVEDLSSLRILVGPQALDTRGQLGPFEVPGHKPNLLGLAITGTGSELHRG